MNRRIELLEAALEIESITHLMPREAIANVARLVTAMRDNDRDAAMRWWSLVCVTRHSLDYARVRRPLPDRPYQQWDDALSAAIAVWRWLWGEPGTLSFVTMYAEKARERANRAMADMARAATVEGGNDGVQP